MERHGDGDGEAMRDRAGGHREWLPRMGDGEDSATGLALASRRITRVGTAASTRTYWCWSPPTRSSSTCTMSTTASGRRGRLRASGCSSPSPLSSSVSNSGAVGARSDSSVHFPDDEDNMLRWRSRPSMHAQIAIHLRSELQRDDQVRVHAWTYS